MTDNTNTDRTDDLVVRGRKSYAALGLFLAELDKEVAWATGLVYLGHTLSQREDGWLLVVRARRGSSRLVAFCGGRDALGCFRQLYYGLYHDQMRWREDRYAK